MFGHMFFSQIFLAYFSMGDKSNFKCFLLTLFQALYLKIKLTLEIYYGYRKRKTLKLQLLKSYRWNFILFWI